MEELGGTSRHYVYANHISDFAKLYTFGTICAETPTGFSNHLLVRQQILMIVVAGQFLHGIQISFHGKLVCGTALEEEMRTDV